MITYKNGYGEIITVTSEDAIAHFKYGISHDIFSEPVISYAKLAIKAMEEQIKNNEKKS